MPGKAIAILHKLLNQKSATSSPPEKPLQKFTDVEIDRAIKELKVKKLRMEITELEERQVLRQAEKKEIDEKIRLYRNLNHSVSDFMKSMIANNIPNHYQPCTSPSVQSSVIIPETPHFNS